MRRRGREGENGMMGAIEKEFCAKILCEEKLEEEEEDMEENRATSRSVGSEGKKVECELQPRNELWELRDAFARSMEGHDTIGKGKEMTKEEIDLNELASRRLSSECVVDVDSSRSPKRCCSDSDHDDDVDMDFDDDDEEFADQLEMELMKCMGFDDWCNEKAAR